MTSDHKGANLIFLVKSPQGYNKQIQLAVRQSEPNQQNLSYNFQLDKENDTGIHTTSLLMNLTRMVSALPTQLSQSRQTNQIIWSHTVIIVTLSKERTLAILQLFQPQFIYQDSKLLEPTHYTAQVSTNFLFTAAAEHCIE